MTTEHETGELLLPRNDFADSSDTGAVQAHVGTVATQELLDASHDKDSYVHVGPIGKNDQHVLMDVVRCSVADVLDVDIQTERLGLVERGSRQRRIASDSDTDDNLRQYLNDIGRYRLFGRQEHVLLGQRMRAGRDVVSASTVSGKLSHDAILENADVLIDAAKARAEFVNSNLRLVVSIAKRYKHERMSTLDIIQEGNLGLAHAVDKYDERKGFAFSTYATWWIRQSIERSLSMKGRMIRVPVHAADDMFQVASLYTMYKNETPGGLSASPQSLTRKVAEELDMPEDKVVEYLVSAADAASLDFAIGDRAEASMQDFVADPVAEMAYAQVEDGVFNDGLMRSLKALLSPRDFEVICDRFGLKDESGVGQTLDDIGKKLGVTRERARQIEQKALARLRHPSAVSLLGKHNLFK